MKKFIKALEGKKTLIMCALGGLTVALKLGGVITDELADALLAALGFGGLAALRVSKKK